MSTATAVANANIAFIKYWGNRDDKLRLLHRLADEIAGPLGWLRQR